MPTPPASGDLNNHTELSAWRSKYTNHLLTLASLLYTDRVLDNDVPKNAHTVQRQNFFFPLATFQPLNGSRVTCVMGALPGNFQLANVAMFFRSRL